MVLFEGEGERGCKPRDRQTIYQRKVASALRLFRLQKHLKMLSSFAVDTT